MTSDVRDRTLLVALVVVCFVASAIAGPQQVTTPDSLEVECVDGELGLLLNAQLSRYAGQGFSGTVLVVREGRVVLLKGYGLADIANNIPNTPSTRFEMNSMTKMFTGVSVLQLAGAGRLKLDDPIKRYLGEFAVAKPGVTVHHLTLHTAGLVPAGTPLNGESQDAFVRDVVRAPRESPPGASYRYTNAGYSLLGAIVERVSGKSFEDYLRQTSSLQQG